MKRFVIGIAGGTGSGKTTVARKLNQAFKNDSVILSHDYYYKDISHLTFEERCLVNFDHPDSLDTELLVEHISKLKQGESIMHPTYDFSNHCRNDQWKRVDSAKIIIVEGILIFTNKALCDLCDIKLFVDTDADVRFIRRLRRDTNKRGRSVESVVNQYLSTVKPMHEQFVEPSKRNADVIIPEGGHNVVALEMVMERVRAHLEKH